MAPRHDPPVLAVNMALGVPDTVSESFVMASLIGLRDALRRW
jgi:hypothetical protein